MRSYRSTIATGATARSYALARINFHPDLFAELASNGIVRSEIRALDIASGTGLLAEGLHACKCRVVASDASSELLAVSKLPARVVAIAEQLPFDARTFDLVTVANAWHWLDRAAAPREIARVLKPSGTILVVYQTHVPMPGSIAELSEVIILRHRPKWPHANSTGINGQVLRDLQAAGFQEINSHSFDVEISFGREAWVDYVCTLSPIWGMRSDERDLFRRELVNQLQSHGEPFSIPHRIFYVHARTGPSAL